MPKLYFYDTGLACSLLRISSSKQLAFHPSFGSLFENFILSDIGKQYCNVGQRPSIYFWRDKNGRLEVDCLIDEGGKLFPIEIKSSPEVKTDFFKGLQQWHAMEHGSEHQANSLPGYLVYAGEEKQQRAGGIALPWKKTDDLVEQIRKVGC